MKFRFNWDYSHTTPRVLVEYGHGNYNASLIPEVRTNSISMNCVAAGYVHNHTTEECEPRLADDRLTDILAR